MKLARDCNYEDFDKICDLSKIGVKEDDKVEERECSDYDGSSKG